MKNFIARFSIFITSVTLGFTQDVDGFDFGYKFGVTRLNHAYSTINQDSTFEIHSDAFSNRNFYANYTIWNESVLFNCNMEGIMYLAFQKTITELKSGPLKAVPSRYDEVRDNNPTIVDPVEGSEDMVHPITGLGDYQWVNLDFAVGGQIKVGVNFAGGFLGANGANNGISLGIAPSIKTWNVQSINIGYIQYGLTGHYVLDNDNANMLISAHLSSMRTVSKRFDKRTGYALEVEFKYYLMEDETTLRPYLSGYLDYRRMKGGVADIFGYKGINKVDIPALNVNAIGVKVGLLIGEI